MVYKTLHFYIFRELLRIFFLTASALTTLLAFGGTFRPLTKQGIDVGQLMIIMMNLMPAMLAYAIPIAALFAAVLVYWRMSTDNELTACRAGGISFIAIVVPAFFLGLVVASVDLVFVNYVVPRFLQSTERAVMRDVGSIIVGQIGRQEKFQFDKLVVYADQAALRPTDEPNTSIVVLKGMALTVLDPSGNGKVVATLVAREATLRIVGLPQKDATEIYIDNVSGASVFDPGNSFRKVTFSLDSLSDRPLWVLASPLKSKPKFLNWRQLARLNQDPSTFPPVQEQIAKVAEAYTYYVVSHRIHDLWEALPPGAPLVLNQAGMGGAPAAGQLRIWAPAARIDPAAPPERSLLLTARNGTPIRVEQMAGGKLQSTYTCDTAEVQLASNQFVASGLSASVQLRDNVQRRDHIRNIGPTPAGSALLSGIVLPEPVQRVTLPAPLILLRDVEKTQSAQLQKLNARVQSATDELFLKIDSEFHSRGSFSLSCLTLVLFGAALGIMLRGKNPLAVFVLGFVPAVVLVMLITAGRQVAESSAKSADAGLILIWSGNVVLLALVIGVYAKLVRH